MSYDLLVFDASAAPREPSVFFAWYNQLTLWQEGHDYNDPANTSDPALRAWYREMIRRYPAMNGPDAKRMGFFDDDRITGYTCARAAIYADFRWSVAEKAQARSFDLARKHNVGFWDVSSSLDVWGPTAGGAYAVQFTLEAI